MKSTYDVIIAGAGPVGLFLACELALAQCAVLILEKSENASSPLKQMPFGVRGLTSPSIEALHRRGLLHDLEIHKHFKTPHSTPAKATRRQVGHFAGISIYEDKIDPSLWPYRLPGDTPPNIMSEMAELESVLMRRAEALGVVIRRGLAVTGFHQANDHVTVHSDDRTFTAQWLVGCDGSRSIVRKLGGFAFDGTEPTFTGYSAKVDIANPEVLKPGRNMTATGMYLQSQPGYLLIQDFDGGAFHQSQHAPTLAHMQEVIRRISDTDATITNVHMATTWTDHSRQATAYRNGRVLLAGDAAHIHSPLGGQGLNLGIGDAMNLGWKLAATIHNKAPEGLLDSYYNERHPLGAQVLDWSRAQVAIMKPTPEARALNTIMRDLIDTRDGATYIAGRIWGMFTQYDFGANHPLVGRSVPNFTFENGDVMGDLMHDGAAILLGDASLKHLADDYGIKHIPGDANVGTVLIRPDGIVAWVGVDGLQSAMEQWFTKQ
ncbi:FAD-dependent monooxygenase [Chitinophaga sedimenti]|uniref:FAD-dependent monooxygenase n=1 Tax=Chitinophaga sedimenti TaxID=2033606 RepID=UPI002004D4DC|nr:FAD-dependent monooxygenase [Chitinophaga sedimenti]MCK7553956.1 FAD-dependent monooxygenase [Chitinophaga sedimenti]